MYYFIRIYTVHFRKMILSDSQPQRSYKKVLIKQKECIPSLSRQVDHASAREIFSAREMTPRAVRHVSARGTPVVGYD